MKYKIGDKFEAKFPSTCFKSGEIVAVMEDAYLLTVNGHVDEKDDAVEDEFFVRRDETDLSASYKLVPNFFERGKTYQYADTPNCDYDVHQILEENHNVNFPSARRQALARRIDKDGQTRWAILDLSSFASMKEV